MTAAAHQHQIPVREDWLATWAEDPLDPAQPIIDPHHHLWDQPGWRYLLDELLADLRSGHAMQPVGETEFVNGVAAMAASGVYGPTRACAGIVGHADLGLGDAVAEVLDAHIAAGGGRFRGIRHMMAHDDDTAVLGPLAHAAPNLCSSPQVHAALKHFAKRQLSLDIWVVEPQLPEVVGLARAFPDVSMVIDHVGTPVGLGRYAGKRDDRFAGWKASMASLAELPNVHMKLGGLGMPFPGFEGMGPDVRPSSETLAAAWKPYIETCIELFGADRCMFESNFPVDRWGADYPTLWNAFKRIASGASTNEKADLFAGTAARCYRLEGLA